MVVTSDPAMILQEQANYYIQLYTSEPHLADPNYLENVYVNKVTMLDRAKLDRVFDMEELEMAVKT